jgi:3-hydroxyisobutyrate dehydrogenase-like beta-hydroxyacid dehydrogenase
MTVIGLLHPGEMGAAIGRCLVGAGHTVLWDPGGRSPATAARAAGAGLTAAGGMDDLVRRSDVILSVCPPHAALDVARGVADRGFTGIFADANAISPATARQVAGLVEAGGATYIDGGIIGLPPETPGQTRLYLSGGSAGKVRDLFGGTAVDARLADGPAFAASALKMAYAAWTKGTAALILAIRALARAEGVEQTLLAEWAMSQPALEQRSERAAGSAALKGWRWVAEMDEIAASMSGAGLPAGFHEAAAEIFRRSPRAAKPGQISLDDVLDGLGGSSPVG